MQASSFRHLCFQLGNGLEKKRQEQNVQKWSAVSSCLKAAKNNETTAWNEAAPLLVFAIAVVVVAVSNIAAVAHLALALCALMKQLVLPRKVVSLEQGQTQRQ